MLIKISRQNPMRNERMVGHPWFGPTQPKGFFSPLIPYYSLHSAADHMKNTQGFESLLYIYVHSDAELSCDSRLEVTDLITSASWSGMWSWINRPLRMMPWALTDAFLTYLGTHLRWSGMTISKAFLR